MPRLQGCYFLEDIVFPLARTATVRYSLRNILYTQNLRWNELGVVLRIYVIYINGYCPAVRKKSKSSRGFRISVAFFYFCFRVRKRLKYLGSCLTVRPGLQVGPPTGVSSRSPHMCEVLKSGMRPLKRSRYSEVDRPAGLSPAKNPSP